MSNTSNISFTTPVGVPTGYAGNSFGALRYNLNSMSGWLFGEPSNSNIYVYSDLTFSDPTGAYAGGIFSDVLTPTVPVFNMYSTTYADSILVKIISDIMVNGDDVLSSVALTPTAYKATYGASDGLLGRSWLPWNVMGLSDGTNYHVKTYYDGGVLNVNPLRREVLWIKLFTFMKISGLGLGSYALVKYGMKKYKRD